MVTTCIYCGERANATRTLHVFPFAQPERFQKWKENIGVTSLKISKFSKLCSDHFDPRCLSKRDVEVTLTANCVPTIFGTYKSACVYCKATKNDNGQTTFHKFPLKNSNRLSAWMTNMKMENFTPSEKHILCSNHFDKDSYDKWGKLKEDAVPTLFALPDVNGLPTSGNMKYMYTGTQSIPEIKETEKRDNDSRNESMVIKEEPEVYVENLPSNTVQNASADDVSIPEPTTPESAVKAFSRVLLDHHDENSPITLKHQLSKTREQLKDLRKQCDAKNKKISRMTKQLTSLKDIVSKLKEKNSVSETAVFISDKTPKTEKICVAMNDFTKICRTCSLQSELISLFIEQPFRIADMLTDVVNLKVIKNDKYPQNICKECFDVLKSAYEFKKRCEDVQNKFDEYIQNDYKQEGIFIVLVKEEINIDDYDIDNTDDRFDYDNDDDNNIKIEPQQSLGNVQNFVEQHLKEGEELLEIKPKIEDGNVKETKDKSKLNTCKYCSRLFSSKKTLIVHTRTHTGERPYICKICNRSFTFLGSLITHKLIHTGEKPHTCTVCNKSFARKNSLTKHAMIHTGKKPFKCKTCEQSFRQRNHLQAHLARHTGEKPYYCTICNKQFSLNQNLKHHIRTHTGESPYQYKYLNNKPKTFTCRTCTKKFPNKSEYNKHKLEEHPEQIQIYLCNFCGKEFTDSLRLKSHLLAHSTDRKHKCTMCDKQFVRKQSLKMHELFHTGERRYQCKLCEQRFKQPSHLRTHMRTHTAEKPYKCRYCEKSFAGKGNLIVHERIHTGETPYICSICNKGFYHLTTMKKHKQTHLLK